MSNAIVSGNALSIEGREYRSDAFGVMLAALGVTTLNIDAAPVEPDGDGAKNFTVAGTAQLLSQNVDVSLYLDFVRGETFEFQFKTTFPSLTLQTLRERNILPDSPFVRPLLSHAYADVEFSFDSEGAKLYVACMESPARIDLFPKLILDKIGFEFLRSYVRPTALLDVYAEIKIGGTPVEVKIEIPLGGSLSPRSWVLTSRSTIPFGSWLSDIPHFLGETVGVSSGDVFPEALDSVKTFFLDDVQILLDPDQRRLRFLSFRMQSVREFKIADSLVISKVGMRVNVTPATPRAEVSLTLFGHVKIKDDANLDVQVMLPANLRTDPWDFFMSGGVDLKDLSDLRHLPVGHRVEDLQLHPGFLTLTSLELKKFEVNFNPFAKTVPGIAFDLLVEAECELIHGFKLKNPRFELTAVNPFDQAGLEPKSLDGSSISGTIAVGDINFDVEAAKQSGGWTFTGRTAPGAVSLSRLVGTLEGKYDLTLPNVVRDDDALREDVTLESLLLQFSTTATPTAGDSSTALFNAKFGFPIADGANCQKAFLSLDARVTDARSADDPRTSKYHREFGGVLTVGSLEFGTKYSDEPQASYFVGAYSDSKGEKKLSELVGAVSPQLAELIPGGLGIGVKDAVFAFAGSEQDPRKFLFGIDLGLHLDLSGLKLIGKYFSGPGSTKIGLDNLQVVFASRPFIEAEAQNLNRLLATFDPPVRPLPEITRPAANPAAPGSVTPPDATTPVLRQGANVAAVLNLGTSSRPLAFPAGPGAQQVYTGAQPIPNAATTDGAIWLDVQKAVGPVHVERVGVEYRAAKLWVLLSASLNAAGLTISLDGLSLGVPLDEFDVLKIEPALRGLGLDYRNDFVELGGSFSQAAADDSTEYSGTAVLKARGLTISAFGSYSTVKEKVPGEGEQEVSSFLIFGLLDYPIGGPPIFYVTGLAAGFGYHRKLVVPPVEKLGQFSLIRAARKDSETLGNILPALRGDARPSPGEHFLAAGVMFTSFKLVETTVLLTAAFGKRFELHVLGSSRLRMPPAPEKDALVPPVAEAELLLKGSFIPDDGFLELRAQLTPTSYLFKKDCHLTGGFAFLCWFKDGGEGDGPGSGDFVLTLGGYHPAFRVPAHYPNVPRLGFNWQVTPQTLSLRGDVYFALTPGAVMAGGHLQAEWRSGSVFAWFKAGVDFLIAWKPYHYDARAYIDMGVEVTFEFFGTQRLSLDVGADLHVWGPGFAGDATIHLWIISFTIHFGEGESGEPKAIPWDEFQHTFLLKEIPKPDEPKPEVCSVAVGDGLVHKGEGNDLGVVNGKHLCLVTDSRIPSTEAAHDGIAVELREGTAKTFGIAPMGVASVESSTHTVIIERDGRPVPPGEFTYTAVTKNVPAALWGATLTPRPDGPRFVRNALSGVEIRPAQARESRATAAVDRRVLVAEDKTPQSCRWEREAGTFTPAEKSEEKFKEELGASLQDTRNKLLAGLGIAAAGLDDSLAYDFLKQPQSEAA